MQNLGRKPIILGDVDATLKFWSPAIHSVVNSQLSVRILSYICSVCRKMQLLAQLTTSPRCIYSLKGTFHPCNGRNVRSEKVLGKGISSKRKGRSAVVACVASDENDAY